MNKFKSGNNKPNIGIVGATGLVGRTFLKVIKERKLDYNELFLFASEKSAGTIIKYNEKQYIINEATSEIFKNLDIAFFSAGSDISLKLAPIAAENKCIVIDNSSAWRMKKEIPLIVPEVNPNDFNDDNYIIANPNCSTIQLVAALKPLSDKYGLKRVVCSTYQSISGAGQKGIDKLYREIEGNFLDNKKIAFSTLFHSFDVGMDFTNEEIKMINETRKILNLPDLAIAVTCVRVPTLGGHGESINVELKNDFDIKEVFDLIANTKGLVLMDNPAEDIYPTPEISNNTDEVYIGRIRRDNSVENGLYLWVVADNVRKGAATNAIQIAELIINRKNNN